MGRTGVVSIWMSIAVGPVACGHGAVSAPASVSAQSETEPKLTSDRNRPTVEIFGELTAADIEAITAAIRRVDTSRLRSINQREDGVFVRTGCIRGEHACEFGAWFILKKVNGTWTIVKQQFWMT